MNAASQERLARNESFFREVNERIRDVAEGLNGDSYDFLCECADAGCAVRVPLTLVQYEAVRAHAARFVLAPGHMSEELEHVVAHEGDHVVVEKVGVAGDVAVELDPRSD
jgi:hypothetical protein